MEFLSDTIVILERQWTLGITEQQSDSSSLSSYQVVQIINLYETSFLKEIQDLKYFQHLIRIDNGKGDSAIFVCSSAYQKQQIYKDMNEIIDNLRKQSMDQNQSSLKFPIEVQIIGTEERQQATFKKHTVYIAQIKHGAFQQKIRLRYSEVRDLEIKIKKIWKKTCIDLPHLSNMNFLTNHKTKEIVKRWLLIEQFLQKVLSSELLIKADKQLQKEILGALNLDENFYQLSEDLAQGDEEASSLYSSQHMSNLALLAEEPKDGAELKLDLKATDALYSAQQVYQQNAKYLSGKRQTLSRVVSMEDKSFSLEIECLDSQLIKVQISKLTTASDVCEEIARQK